jgi:excisionase family DNA binding protein
MSVDKDSVESSGRAGRMRYRREMRFFKVVEVAEMLGVCERTVRRWIAGGLLAAHSFGTAVRISEADLRAFIAQHRAP